MLFLLSFETIECHLTFSFVSPFQKGALMEAEHGRKFTVQFFKIYLSEFPCIPQAFHAFHPGQRSIGALMFPLILPLIDKRIRRLVRSHRCGRPSDYLYDLQQTGMIASGLPPALGGTFDLQAFERLVDDFAAEEEALEQQEDGSSDGS